MPMGMHMTVRSLSRTSPGKFGWGLVGLVGFALGAGGHASGAETRPLSHSQDVSVGGAGLVQGVVRGPNGSNCAGALVCLILPIGAERRTSTDPNGRFQFEGVEPGHHGLVAQTPLGQRFLSLRIWREGAAPRSAVRFVDVTLDGREVTVRGQSPPIPALGVGAAGGLAAYAGTLAGLGAVATTVITSQAIIGDNEKQALAHDVSILTERPPASP